MLSAAVLDASGRLTLTGLTAPVPWWSFTKTVLAAAALRLVARGALALHDPIDPRGFSLAQLLRHQAGLPDYGPLRAYQEDVAARREPWSFQKVLAETGVDDAGGGLVSDWTYSNIGYRFVADLIEQASEMPLGDALRVLVLHPADAETARLAKTPDDLADVAMGQAGGYDPGWVYHGLLVGPTAEAARVLRALLDGRILDPAWLGRMTAPLPLPQFASALRPDPAYGYGLMMRGTEPFAHPIGHSGAGPGSRIAVYAAGGRVAAVWKAADFQPEPETDVLSALGRDRF